MTETTLPPSSGPSMRLLTHVAYGLFALGVATAGVLGVAIVAAVVLVYLKRSDAAGTLYAAHLDWLLSTFWWGLLYMAISSIATLIFIGWFGVIATTLWVVYRLVKGWLALCEGGSPVR